MKSINCQTDRNGGMARWLPFTTNGGKIPRMNPYAPPTTPPEPRKPRRRLTPATWALILLTVLLLGLTVLLLVLLGDLQRFVGERPSLI